MWSLGSMKVAFVVQRYGEEVNGGSEYHCRMVAEKMSKHWKIDILTTCALNYVSWENHYPKGIESKNDIKIFRFPVLFKRNKVLFDLAYSFLTRLHRIKANPKINFKNNPLKIILKLLALPLSKKIPLLWLEKIWMILQGPYSPKLFRYLKNESHNYDFIVFFTYVYATCYFGLKNTNTRAVLVPTAHEDTAIEFSLFKEMFKIPKALIPNTEEEIDLIFKKFPHIKKTPVSIIGTGIEFPKSIPDPDSFLKKFHISYPYIIYVGRIEESKGCDLLFKYFLTLKKRSANNLKLILVGKSFMKIPNHQDIISLGFLSNSDKNNAIKASELLVMPSPFESLSIVLLEAWYFEKAVLVNGNCKVLKGQCERSGGGICFFDEETFCQQLEILTNPKTNIDLMAHSGKKFVIKHYSWESISKKYLSLSQELLKAK